MRTFRRPALAALLALIGLAITWPISAYGDNTATRQAQALVEQMRDAPAHYDFTGAAVIEWRDGNRTRRASVDVTDEGGAVEVSAGTSVVYDDGVHTYLTDGDGWTSVLEEPPMVGVPAPASGWALSSAAGPRVANRPTTVVVATRRDGTVAQRLYVDATTKLLLRREVLARDGTVERSVVFTEIELGVPTTPLETPADRRTRAAEPLTSVPDGYRAPATVGSYALVTRSKHPDGVLLSYDDGMFTTSVFEQRGDLDWGGLPKGGTTTKIAGTRARRYSEPNGEVLVWQRDGIVYTCVSDAPTDVSTKMVDTFAGPGRSGLERVADYVLGPFGWN